ncbi:avidin-related protein 4/5-like [Scyliorhinus torazame]|uniref:avidin-related protein 4/5-like n=1 Tax=Scyliorhinus torazame TaxID=75743 RepID=UPI003B5B1B87
MWIALAYLTLIASVAAFSVDQNLGVDFAGCWQNELGSILKINLDENGSISGEYVSDVSETGHRANGNMVGYHQATPEPTFGFVVRWTCPGCTGSVSVWTGQYFKQNNVETLETMWLFRTTVMAKANNWEATRVGQDVFKRFPGSCPV